MVDDALASELRRLTRSGAALQPMHRLDRGKDIVPFDAGASSLSPSEPNGPSFGWSFMQATDDFLRQLLAIVKSGSSTDQPSGNSAPLDYSLPSSAPLSLMITKKQRAQLKERGFSDEAVAEMRPDEAHKHLGL